VTGSGNRSIKHERLGYRLDDGDNIVLVIKVLELDSI